MSWSITVNNIPEFEGFDLELQEMFSSQHPSYARDANDALLLARMIGLKSATLCGARTPNPYGGDEIVDVSVRGTPIYQDFLLEMREIIAQGPDAGSDLARHYAALARLRSNPCSHQFEIEDMPTDTGPEQWLRKCSKCGVMLNGTMLYFQDEEEHING